MQDKISPLAEAIMMSLPQIAVVGGIVVYGIYQAIWEFRRHGILKERRRTAHEVHCKQRNAAKGREASQLG